MQLGLSFSSARYSLSSSRPVPTALVFVVLVSVHRRQCRRPLPGRRRVLAPLRSTLVSLCSPPFHCPLFSPILADMYAPETCIHTRTHVLFLPTAPLALLSSLCFSRAHSSLFRHNLISFLLASTRTPLNARNSSLSRRVAGKGCVPQRARAPGDSVCVGRRRGRAHQHPLSASILRRPARLARFPPVCTPRASLWPPRVYISSLCCEMRFFP